MAASFLTIHKNSTLITPFFVLLMNNAKNASHKYKLASSNYYYSSITLIFTVIHAEVNILAYRARVRILCADIWGWSKRNMAIKGKGRTLAWLLKWCIDGIWPFPCNWWEKWSSRLPVVDSQCSWLRVSILHTQYALAILAVFPVLVLYNQEQVYWGGFSVQMNGLLVCNRNSCGAHFGFSPFHYNQYSDKPAWD